MPAEVALGPARASSPALDVIWAVSGGLLPGSCAAVELLLRVTLISMLLRLRWSEQNWHFFFVLEKTIEKTAAGIAPVLAACSVLILRLAFTGYVLTIFVSLAKLAFDHCSWNPSQIFEVIELDARDQESFNNVKQWLNEIERYAREI
ncbi:unnamed protein product [Prunus armeniaca]